MNRFGLWIMILVVAVGALIAVLQKETAIQDNNKFTVVTTFYPLTQLTKPIAGDNATVAQLVDSGQGVHDYHVKGSDIELLKSADLLILNGSGLEREWLDPLLASANRPDLLAVDLAEALEQSGVELLTLDEEEEGLTTNPHIWLSPRNALVFAQTIRDELSRLDPTNAAAYQANAAAFMAELTALDSDLTARVAGFSQHQFIAFHDAFPYFARDYGLEQVATIELSPGAAPTPGQLANVQNLVRSLRLRALFTEPQFSSAIVDQLAQDLDIQVLELDPLETGSDDDGYVQAMQRNLANLEKGLQ